MLYLMTHNITADGSHRHECSSLGMFSISLPAYLCQIIEHTVVFFVWPATFVLCQLKIRGMIELWQANM